ncbi:hypothetical protein LBMAG49_07870 [Planctomycetota bacterium]|nr:hypothetical protein LBMAG49_07870 [Planctomycetota bacterium]
MQGEEAQQHIPLAPNLAALTDAEHPWDVFAQLRSVRELTTNQGQPYLVLELVDLSAMFEGKIWSDSTKALQAAKAAVPNQTVKLRGMVKSYRGKPQLIIENLRPVLPGDEGFDLGQIVDPALSAVEDLVCRTLVIDIETVPAHDRTAMPESVAEALTQFAQRKEPGAGKDIIEARIGMAMGLSPLFGKVVSLAIGDGDAEPGQEDITVLAVPPEGALIDPVPPWLRLMSEPELLAAFWALASKAEVVVTFNGRNFDIPFLATRSMIHGIPARCDLLSQRFSLKPHLDLIELLNQRDKGPGKLDVICWALGIESPKGEMDGSMVAPAYARGEILKIAEYNAHDVRATTAVFRKVRDSVLRYRKDWS